MGIRKRSKAELLKEARKGQYIAKLNDCPSSPRKMRLVTELIKGVEVTKALEILKYTPKEAAPKLEKLLRSAIANWQNKNEGVRIEDSNLYVKNVYVNQGRTLKRIQPAPQGRAYRIRKRSNHVTIILDTYNIIKKEEQTVENKE
jgi:large subunit ribosomal protein L22